ncbi:hypothetical protein I302_103843 [Kwoniella bestiolae CBS 10118]|uniref:Uncharacterized protein n=1 Tax=Kwoniella bestiolae CBS 10118 TaxID=1296100 RepID=A0A1B9G9M6_9TREE|nr:hypothetical protein I302_02546 [Kwoniella bestiolae CBS 10118]OCF27701.1 hypothetical protein I302_02546 [Kwoniella bestiolae CBS 10118]
MSDILSREEQSSRGDNTPVPARIEQDLLSFFTSGVRVATALNATMDDLSEKIDAQHKSIKSMYERDCTGDRFELHFPSRKGLVCANPFVKLPWVPVEIDKDQHRSDIEEKWRNYIVGDISAIRQPDDGTILVPVIYRPPEVVRAARMAGWTDEEEDTRTK